MAVNSKVDLCNMAMSHFGNKKSINNIDTPTTDAEKVFATWYEVTIQSLLKQTMPNFSLEREILAKLVYTPKFGFGNAYQYPSDCLKVLGIGDIEKKENDYTVEGDKLLTDQNYDSGLPLRYVKDITDVSKFSPEFKILASWVLADNTVMEITQDVNKAARIDKKLPAILSSASALNAQENRPIRISSSNYKKARYQYSPTTGIKK